MQRKMVTGLWRQKEKKWGYAFDTWSAWGEAKITDLLGYKVRQRIIKGERLRGAGVCFCYSSSEISALCKDLTPHLFLCCSSILTLTGGRCSWERSCKYNRQPRDSWFIAAEELMKTHQKISRNKKTYRPIPNQSSFMAPISSSHLFT